MNFIEIVRKANELSGIQGTVDSISPNSSIQSALVGFVKDSYIEIQLMRDSWSWLLYDGVFAWAPVSTEYINPAISKYYNVYFEGDSLKFIDYDSWVLSPPTKIGAPTSFTIKPESNSIIINPVEESCVIHYRGYKNPEELTTSSQIPAIPYRFHLCIAYKAASMMSAYMGNYSLANSYLNSFDALVGQLLRTSNLPKTIKNRPFV